MRESRTVSEQRRFHMSVSFDVEIVSGELLINTVEIKYIEYGFQDKEDDVIWRLIPTCFRTKFL